MTIRIETVSEPLSDPTIALPAISALERAESMGLLDDRLISRLDQAALRDVVRQLSDKGIAVGLRPLLDGDRLDAGDMRAIVTRLAESLDGSPTPDREVAALSEVLEPGLLATLVGVSPVTVNRWLRHQRTADGVHADRIHWLSGVVADLRTAYNALGVRRWFVRPRAQLAGRSPLETLGANWDPDSEDAARVRALAAWLTSPAAT